MNAKKPSYSAQSFAIARILDSVPSEERLEVASRAGALVRPDIKNASLEKLFDWQTANLKRFVEQKELEPLRRLLSQLGDVPRDENTLPFVVVPKLQGLTLSKRLRRVMLNNRRGTNYLAEERLGNFDDLPKEHYLAVFVGDGSSFLGVLPGECFRKFKENGLLGGTAAEVVTFATLLPETLLNHNIDAPGSYYDGADGRSTPCLSYSPVRIMPESDWPHPKLLAYAERERKIPYWPFCGSLSVLRRLTLSDGK